jgi:hypothetical protein
MDKRGFLEALRQLGGDNDQSISDLYHDLYHEEQNLAVLQQSVTEANLESLRRDIASFESAIQTIKQVNADHERRIYACSHLLGAYIIRKQFAQNYFFRYQRDKFRRLCELCDHKIDALRTKLAEKPRKLRPTKSAKCVDYIHMVQAYLDAEMDLTDVRHASEVADIDSESKAFALVDEISEYYLAAKGLGLDPPEFNLQTALEGILGLDDDA